MSTLCESWLSVTSARRLYLVHVGLAAVALAAVFVGAAVALSKIELGVPSAGALLAACRGIIPAKPGLGVLVLGLGSLGLGVLVLAARSLARQLHQQRRFLRRLARAKVIEIRGRELVLVESAIPQAFCAGFLRPRIYLSTAALDRLSETELHAVVAHEAHHQRSYDPLRILLGTVAAEALFFLPALRRLSKRYRELAELGADEAARKTEGAPALASALLAFGERGRGPAPVVGIAAERVDHLLGGQPRWQLPLSMFTGSLIILFALLTLVLTTAPGLIASDGVSVPSLLAEACMIGMLAVPLVVGGWLLLFWKRRQFHRPSAQA